MRSLRKIKLILSIVFMALCVFSMLKSCAYAWTLQDIADNLITLEDKGLLGAGVGQTIATHVLNDTGSDTCFYMKNNNRNGYAIVVADYLYICFCGYSQLNVDYNNGIYNYANSGGLANDWSSSGPWYNLSNGSQKAKGVQTLNNKTITYAYTMVPINTRSLVLGAGEEYGGTYLSESFDFSPNYDYIVNQDGYFGVNTKKYNYSVRSWLLGQITSYLEDYPIIHMKLYDQNYSGDYIAESYYNTGTQVNSSTDLFVNTVDNKVYVKSRLLYYNNIYTLVLYPETASGTISSDNYVGTFLYLPLNANVSGDVVVSTGDGDFTNQNQINDLLYIPTESGDLGLINMPSINIEDPSNDFFVWLLAELQDFFTNFNNTNLTIPIWTENFTIASNVFVLSQEPLKTFLGIGWWFACGVPILKWIRYMIETIRSGNIPQVDDKSDLLNNVL